MELSETQQEALDFLSRREEKVIVCCMLRRMGKTTVLEESIKKDKTYAIIVHGHPYEWEQKFPQSKSLGLDPKVETDVKTWILTVLRSTKEACNLYVDGAYDELRDIQKELELEPNLVQTKHVVTPTRHMKFEPGHYVWNPCENLRSYENTIPEWKKGENCPLVKLIMEEAKQDESRKSAEDFLKNL